MSDLLFDASGGFMGIAISDPSGPANESPQYRDFGMDGARHHWLRQALDGKLHVRTENGNVVAWPPQEPLRPGCEIVSDDETRRMYTELHGVHAPNAHGVRPGTYRDHCARRWTDDRDVNDVENCGALLLPALMEESKKR